METSKVDGVCVRKRLRLLSQSGKTTVGNKLLIATHCSAAVPSVVQVFKQLKLIVLDHFWLSRLISPLLARLMGQYCFACCHLSSASVVICNARGRSAAAGPSAWPFWRLTLQDGTVRLRPVRATPCFYVSAVCTAILYVCNGMIKMQDCRLVVWKNGVLDVVILLTIISLLLCFRHSTVSA